MGSRSPRGLLLLVVLTSIGHTTRTNKAPLYYGTPGTGYLHRDCIIAELSSRTGYAGRGPASGLLVKNLNLVRVGMTTGARSSSGSGSHWHRLEPQVTVVGHRDFRDLLLSYRVSVRSRSRWHWPHKSQRSLRLEYRVPRVPGPGTVTPAYRVTRALAFAYPG
eukprot:1422297-Rhodomonas_salina.1